MTRLAKPRKPLMLAGLVLLSLGLERLLNAYLLGRMAGNRSAPLVIGIVCAFAGVAVLAAALLARRPSQS